MEKKHAREQVRAQIAAPVLYRVFNIAFAVVFFAVVVLAVLMNPNVAYYYSWYWLLAALAAGMLAGFGASRLFMLIKTSPKKSVEMAIVAILMVVMALLQTYAIWGLLPKPAEVDDFGSVYTAAASFALNGIQPGDYFLINPTHTGTYTLLAGFFSLLAQLGMTDFILPSAILNTLAIDGAVLLLYFCGRRLWSARRAIFLLAVAVVSVPFLLYAPVVYSTTLALPFVTGMMLLWLKARSAWRSGNLRGAVVQFCVLSALAGLGGLIKATVLILWIAIALDLLLLLSGKGRLRLLLAGLGCAALIFVGGAIGLRHTPLMSDYDADDGFPLRGFVLMGLGGNGGASADNLELVMAQEGVRARATFINAEIAQRLGDMGFAGVLEHLGYKIGYTYGDGTGGAAQVLEDNAGRWSSLHEIARPAGGYFGIMAYLAFAIQTALLAWTVVGAIKSVLRKNDALTFARIALFGMFLFLLVWKTGPGELVCFLPLLMLCAVEASPMRALVATHPQKPRLEPEVPPVGALPAEDTVTRESGTLARPEPDHWPEFPQEPVSKPPVQPVVLPAYYDHIQPDLEQPASVLPTGDGHRVPTEGGWLSGLGEEYRITGEDEGPEAVSANGVQPEAAMEPEEYDTDALEQWPEPQFPPADPVPARQASEPEVEPIEPATEPVADETDLNTPVLEEEQPRWVTIEGPVEAETAGQASVETENGEPAEPEKAAALKLPEEPEDSENPASSPPVIPEAGQDEPGPREAQVEALEMTASLLEAPIESPPDTVPEPEPKLPQEPQAEPPQEPQAEPQPERFDGKPLPTSVEAISDALEAELTLRDVLREVLPPKKPLAPGEDPNAPAKIGTWDPSRPLPRIDDEVSRILSEISEGKKQTPVTAPIPPVVPAPAPAVSPPVSLSGISCDTTAAAGHSAAQPEHDTPWKGGLDALRNKRFDDMEDFDISVLLTGKPANGERILPEADKAASDTLRQQMDAGLVQHPLAEGKAEGRGTEVWNAKYNTWQDYQAPMWPSAPGKWEKAPTAPKEPTLEESEEEQPE